MKISTILDQIDLGTMALPKFQRRYVWNREQVRDLMNSLYRKFSIGSLFVWIVRSDEARQIQILEKELHLSPNINQ